MRISKYTVRNFKSIEDGTFEVSDDAILIGKNNSGKSNIIKSLEAFRENILQKTDQHFGREDSDWFSKSVIGKDTSKEISWKIIFELTDEERLSIMDSLTLSNGPHRSSVKDVMEEDWFRNIQLKIKKERTGPASFDYYLFYNGKFIKASNMSSNRNTFRHSGYNVALRMSSGTLVELIEDSVRGWNFVSPIREPKDLGKALRNEDLDRRGENLVQVLNFLSSDKPDIFEKIRKSYIDIMEGVSDLSINFDKDAEELNYKTIMVEEDGFDTTFKSSDISSGSKEILVLLAQIFLSGDETDVLAIEEPELHLHPGATKKVYNVLQEQAKENDVQLIISTHSSVFVNETPVENLVRVERKGTSVMRSVSEEDVDRELKDLGYDQSELLQSEGVILVEGRSDRLILGRICEVFDVDLNDLGIEIIELEGGSNVKKHSVSLVKIFYSFDIPYLFIVDSDDNEPHDVWKEYSKVVNKGRWWFTIPDRFHVWEEYSIESYLLIPEAIATVLDTTVKKVEGWLKEAIEKEDVSNEKAEEILEYVFKQEATGLKRNEEAYLKGENGSQIAKAIDRNEFSEEVEDVIEQISTLPDRPPSEDSK